MTPFTARCTLVGAAVVLLVVGLVVPVEWPSRAVLLGAAGCCAVLDVLVVRATRVRRSRGAECGADVADVVVLVPTPSGQSGPVDGTVGTGTHRRPIVLGTASNGREVAVDDRSRPHIVVIGSGVLALAVFRAVVSQVRAAAGPDDEVRAACGAEARAVVAAGADHCPAMPSGTAAVVVDRPAHAASPDHASRAAKADHPDRAAHPDDADRAGSPNGPAHAASPERPDRACPPTRTTVVLVPGLSVLPRHWDVAVEVTRHGCTVRHPHERRGTPVAPALPQLQLDEPG
ncbi:MULTISPECIES: hypothetical protein [unclassified Curtobacterium]|uniref:hypothetical protein n=1 Tax=unclassified Curtobacterium TaxID=257496 RepID=UPI0008DC6A0B|nr:hypothetical protein [Curtobacterium sp. MCBA15_016]OII19837.1 hypothetical protein BIV03_02920 [Curtobacterium sp. MCBA15_016]